MGQNKFLLALGAIALGSAIAPGEAAAADADADYQVQCAQLSQQSAKELRQYIEQNPDSACAEFAASLLAERTNPGLGGRSTAGFGGRY